MAKEQFIDEVSSTAASTRPKRIVNQDQVVGQQPQPRLFFGGTPPRAKASRPSGFVQLDENGNEIKKTSNSAFANDITSDPNFRAAFGNNEIINDFVSGKTDKHSVTITNVEKDKPVSSEGTAFAGSGNFEGSSK